MSNHNDVLETLADLRRRLETVPCKGRGVKRAIQSISDAEMWLRFDDAKTQTIIVVDVLRDA